MHPDGSDMRVFVFRSQVKRGVGGWTLTPPELLFTMELGEVNVGDKHTSNFLRQPVVGMK
jgi:hypothetical protein